VLNHHIFTLLSFTFPPPHAEDPGEADVVDSYGDLPEAQSRNLPLRLTPKKVHDDSYKGLADATAWIDSSMAVDLVVVVRRNSLVTYENEIQIKTVHLPRDPPSCPADQPAVEEAGELAAVPGSSPVPPQQVRAWVEQSAAHEALEIERLRPLSEDELNIALEDIRMLKKLNDDAVASQIGEIEKMLADLCNTGDGESSGRSFPELSPLRTVDFVSSDVEDN
jgi:hypothetical protein